MKKKDKKGIYIMLILILIVIVLICLVTKETTKKSINSETVRSLLNSDNDSVIVFTSNDCKYCSETIRYLEKNKINYNLYNMSKNSKSDFNKALDYLGIDRNVFGEPAIIYIKDKMMFANIININDDKVIETFVKDYNLKKVK